jgi:pimeloyl-ACP methyl ester carboxylesterase
MEPFTIRIADSDLDDLHQRLAQTRLGASPAAEPWESGVDYSYLEQLISHWRDGYDWRTEETRLNSFPQFRPEVDGQNIHFVHVLADRDRYPDPIPIILSHGWPYSFIEMLPIVPLLTDPLAHGGTELDGFDVVVPSLPGYGFSDPLAEGSFISERVAQVWHQLMTDTLGYASYATYGEDVGTGISDYLAASYPDAVIGLFATHAAFPPEERKQDLSPSEEEFVAWLNEKWKTGRGYAHIQGTRPDTLAVGLNDSPAGLLAWLVEKFREWSGPEFEQSWTHDDLLTTTSLYWFTRSIGTSFLPYYDAKQETPVPMISVPVGVSVQWGERGFPREYAERTYTDIRTWKDLPRGGHFTVKQTPDLVAADMRAFFRTLRT